jgi:hypothetical protein
LKRNERKDSEWHKKNISVKEIRIEKEFLGTEDHSLPFDNAMGLLAEARIINRGISYVRCPLLQMRTQELDHHCSSLF